FSHIEGAEAVRQAQNRHASPAPAPCSATIRRKKSWSEAAKELERSRADRRSTSRALRMERIFHLSISRPDVYCWTRLNRVGGRPIVGAWPTSALGKWRREVVHARALKCDLGGHNACVRAVIAARGGGRFRRPRTGPDRLSADGHRQRRRYRLAP